MIRTQAAPLRSLAWVGLLALLGLMGTGAVAFLWPPVGKLSSETIPRSFTPEWALPAGRVALLVPEVSSVPAKWPYARPIREWQLRAIGFVLVRTATELERAVEDGAVVIWVHRDAVPMVDPDWLRARYREGYAVGVINGTMIELWGWFGLGDLGGGWIRPGLPRPAFAMVHTWDSQVAPGVSRRGSGGTSEWFNLGMVVEVSRRAADVCTR